MVHLMNHIVLSVTRMDSMFIKILAKMSLLQLSHPI